MPRERKYKVWDKENKEWIELAGDVFITYMDEMIQVIDGDEFEAKVLENVEIVDYTELKDKKEKEIFEGDICQDDGGTVVQILWSDHYQWGCKVIKGCTLTKGLTFPLWHWDNCKENRYRQLEVIGNIYENPELMEAQ